MQYVAGHGYPVPHVVSVEGRDIVMERLDGHTMLADFTKRPWRLRRHAATLAGLLDQLHEIRPVDWLTNKLGGGDALVHLDLHPDNVMLTSRGPVVIDWSNAGRGDPYAEIADLWVLFKSAQPPASRIARSVIGLGRGLFVDMFINHFDREKLRCYLKTAAEHRSRDRNMSDLERERMRRFAEREGLP